MKESLKGFMLGGIPFGITMGIFSGLTSNNLQFGIVAGAIMGIGFGFALSVFVKIQSTKFRKNRMTISGGQKILMEGGANHFKNKESVGGYLILTDKELIFKSHNINIQNHHLIIPLNQITGVKTSLTLGVIPNGLRIITNTAIEEFDMMKEKFSFLTRVLEITVTSAKQML